MESIDKSEIILYLIDSTTCDKDIGIEIDELNKLKKKYEEKSIILIFTKADLVKNKLKGVNWIQY